MASSASPKRTVVLCTNDSPSTSRQLGAQLNPTLDLAKIAVQSSCSDDARAKTTNARYIGRFLRDSQGNVSLLIEHTGHTRAVRQRAIPWLDDTDQPLLATMNANKTMVLGIVIDNLLLDLSHIQLSKAPTIEAVQKNKPRSPLDSEKSNLFGGFEAQAGMEYFTESAFAPYLSLGLFLGKNRLLVSARAVFGFDSSFQIGERPFDTSEFGARLGLGYLFWKTGKHHLGAEVVTAWRFNVFKRADQESAEEQTWSDWGVGLTLFGRYQIVGILGLVARLGVELYPTARVARIKDGPSEKVNLIVVPLTLGFDLVF